MGVCAMQLSFKTEKAYIDCSAAPNPMGGVGEALVLCGVPGVLGVEWVWGGAGRGGVVVMECVGKVADVGSGVEPWGFCGMVLLLCECAAF